MTKSEDYISKTSKLQKNPKIFEINFVHTDAGATIFKGSMSLGFHNHFITLALLQIKRVKILCLFAILW